MTAEALPYGPETAAIRRFLVRLAGLGAADRRAIVQGWRRLTALPAYDRAETTLAQVIERSGREPARDALSGPLLQLVRAPSAPGGTTVPAASVNEASSPEASMPERSLPEGLDPVAEPALAALLALLVRDLLDSAAFDVLYAACADRIPLRDVIAPHVR